MKIRNRITLAILVALVHFPLQAIAFWGSAIDVFPGDPFSYTVRFYVWNTISAIVGFPFITFSFNLCIEPFEQLCRAHAPMSYIVAGILDSFLWAVIVTYIVDRIRKKRESRDNKAMHVIAA